MGSDVIARLSGELRPEMIEAVRRCRAHGLVTALLTNNVVSMSADDASGWSGAARPR